jgi:hypothetical protein
MAEYPKETAMRDRPVLSLASQEVCKLAHEAESVARRIENSLFSNPPPITNNSGPPQPGQPTIMDLTCATQGVLQDLLGTLNRIAMNIDPNP